ncbi:M16 family metallopeptidase [Pendulispora albinea]|uniref:Insulinase family protein n=1 Tax=Pendulispora albinea TaxID=2741071 RepID=A0ABZ2M9B6_9BACT
MSSAHDKIEKIELDGGAVLFVESSHTIPLVDVVVSLRSGAAHDAQDKQGLFRTTFGMLRRGARDYTARQIEDAIDRLGSEVSIDVNASVATVFGQVIERNLEPFIELFATLLESPTFPEDEFGRLKREIVADLIGARDNDRALAQRAFRRGLFRDHPYSRSSAGTIPGVESLTTDDVRANYRKHFVKGNVVIGFSGDITREAAERYARRLIQALPDGPRLEDPVPPPSPVEGRRLVFVDKPERTQTQIIIGRLGTSPHDPDHVALTVANSVFGGTFTSRLMREVRSKRGWSYGASSRLGVDRQRHSFSMVTFPAATDAPACIALELELLTDLLDNGITARELAFIKRYLARSYAFEIDTANKRLHQALDVELLGLPKDYYSSHVTRVEAITLEEANGALKNRLNASDLLISIVGTASEIFDKVRDAIPNLAAHDVVPFDRD